MQLIDLDAAKGSGTNEAMIASICARLPCRVGGGIRTAERAQATLALGATRVILGSALFRDGQIDREFIERLADGLGPERLIAAVDSRRGHVVVNGWRTALSADDG